MTPRYNLAPLAAILHQEEGDDITAHCRRLGIPRSCYYRAQRQGISVVAADRWATRIGTHPAVVWNEWAEDVT